MSLLGVILFLGGIFALVHEVWISNGGRRVTRQGKPTGARLYDPKCSCGWKGKTDSKDRAQAQAFDHWREYR